MENKITVKEARNNAGFTVRSMAERMGMYTSTYFSKESGKTSFLVHEAIQFSEIVGLKISDIFLVECAVIVA